MLLAVLNMPIDMWDSSSPIDEMQRHSRYMQAAKKIECMDNVIKRFMSECSFSDDLLVDAQKALDI
jgi:hypothetical protein